MRRILLVCVAPVFRLTIVVSCVMMSALEAHAGTAMKVAAGSYHTCALTPAGEVLCWGLNSSGQLGDGTTANRPLPTTVTGLVDGVAAIAAGNLHTCALTTTGGVVCWGGNYSGQLGDGTTTDRLTPTAVSALGSGVAAITAGWAHTCALTVGGGVMCWGSNYAGQLGDGTTTGQLTPTPIPGLESGVAAIAAGVEHSCALKASGVLCWGDNRYGQLGDGTTTDRLTPAAVAGLGSGIEAIAAGEYHTCAITAGGGVVCWGGNNAGQLGDGTQTDRPMPTAVSGLASGVRQIESEDHTCAVTVAGGVVCWGVGYRYRLGNGTENIRTVPTAVSGLMSGVTAVSTGGCHGCAVTTGGGVLCWGYNDSGQVGDGTWTTRPTPVRVPGFGTTASSDLTGDGLSDVVWRHATRGEVWLWPMDGAAKMAEWHVRTVGEPGWEIRGLGDQTGDGTADVLWRHTTGMLYLWTMSEETIVAETYLGTVAPAYDIVGTGDYNGDGKSDILWRHQTNGELWVWLMNGAATVSATYVMTVDPGYAVVGSGDVNGDGKADIVWRHKTGGDVWVWLMNGATPTAMTYVTTVGDLGYQIVGVADHTGDGKADILWWHTTRGEVWLWPMNGTTLVSQSYVGMVPDTGYRIVGNGDYNGDGQADILWHHATRGEAWVWLMNGAAKLSETYVGSVPDTGYRIVGR
jgi:alpha-tubulin suppressor-like RCC1 family protein